MNKKQALIIFLFIFNSISCKFIDKSFISLADPEAIVTITNDSQSELLDAIAKLNKNGGTIYIDTPVINISQKSAIRITGSIAGGLVGVQQSNGEYPRIDFKTARDAKANNYGFYIQGTNQFIKYLIIENAGHQGIYITGSKNTIDHVITRYNSDSGIQISEGADSNTINYSYSYRNCDLVNYGKNADGFAPKLDAKNTVFNYCFAWDNCDDGWDSFDKEGQNTNAVTYLNMFVGIMEILMLLLENMIMIMVKNWIKICYLSNNLWNLILILKKIIIIKILILIMEK